MSDLDQLRRALADARDRSASLSKTLRSRQPTAELWRAWEAACEEELRAERRLAEADGGEYAETLDFALRWDTGAPLPQLVHNDNRTLLGFHLQAEASGRIGVTARAVGADDPMVESHGLVEFHRCRAAKLGSPNDEVLSGHPLYGRGLESYRAQVVRRSRWLAEIERINSVHPQYRADSWRSLNHYVFWFHDSTFECIAESFTAERRDGTTSDLLVEMCRRAISRRAIR